MKSTICSIAFGAIVSPIFVSIIYNFITQFDSPYAISFSLIFSSVLLTWLNYKLFRKKIILAGIFTILPIIVIDASVLFTSPALVPLRFPISSIFPVLGFLMAVTFFKWRIFVRVSLLAILLVFTHGYFVYPILLYKKVQADAQKHTYNAALLDVPLITLNGDTVRLSDTIISRVNLVEIFFVGCTPCSQKAYALKKLKKRYDRNIFEVINICDGERTSYKSFVNYALNREASQDIFLYAPDSTIRALFGNDLGFPFEQMVSVDKKFLDKELGYNSLYEKFYLKKKAVQINRYAKEF